MNRSSAPLVLTFLALSACTHQPPLPPSQTVLARPSSHDAPVYVGHYYFAFEVASFNPCGSQDSWWVVSADPSVTQQLRDFVTRHIAEFPRNQLNRVYVRWRGTPSAPGRFGHMGSYSRQFTVLEVLEVRFATPEDCNL